MGNKENIKHIENGFPFKIYENTTKDGYNYYNHWHNEVEIIYVLEGEAEITINFLSRNMKKGDIIFINKGDHHNVIDKKILCNWVTFVFDLNLLSSLIEDSVYHYDIYPLIDGRNIIKDIVDSKLYVNILEEIYHVFLKKDAFYQLKLKGLLFELVYNLYKNNDIIKSKNREDNSLNKLKTAIEYINNHYHENIIVKDIASSCYLNEFYFMKFFKKYMNMTVNEYLNNYRLRRAYKLIKNTDLSITEIAFQTGYNNSSYFIVQFKKMYNITPKELRKNG